MATEKRRATFHVAIIIILLIISNLIRLINTFIFHNARYGRQDQNHYCHHEG